MSLRVRSADTSDAATWDAFVYAHPHASFFHRFGWAEVLERAFGHRAHFLLAETVGPTPQILGILPLVEVKSLLFGHSLASLPFCVYGGILASSPEAEGALREAACALADRLEVGALELRNRMASSSGWPVKSLYYTFRKPLVGEHASNLKAIPNRQRAMLRKALGEGLYGEEDEGTGRLYRVYSESVRNLGTPVFSRRYLHILREVFGRDCRVLMIRKARAGSSLYDRADDATLCAPPPEIVRTGECDAEDVAGVLSFYFRGEVLPYYGGSLGRARSIKGANHFLYWDLMRRSVDEGVGHFDFGRSKEGTGPFQFKKNFGFEAEALPYEYFLVKASQVPDLNPNNPKYRLLVNAWQKLPLPLANLIGPPLARSLG